MSINTPVSMIQHKIVIAKKSLSTNRKIILESGTVFFLRLLGAASSFGFTVILARTLGAEDIGIYYLATTVFMMASLFGRLGLDNVLLRYVASFSSAGEWDKVAGVRWTGLQIAVLASLAISVLVFFLSPMIAGRIFKDPALQAPLRIVVLAILPFTLLILHAEMLKGLRKFGPAVSLQGIGIPLGSALLIIVIGSRLTVVGSITIYVSVIILTALISVVIWYRTTLPHNAGRKTFGVRALLHSSLPLFWVTLINSVVMQVSTISLGIWADSTMVGIYGAVMRVTMLLTLILTVANVVVSPRFASLYAAGNMQALASLFRNSIIVMTLAALLPGLFFIFFPTVVLQIFGPEFMAGAHLLVILSIGQMFNIISGSVAPLLMMTGHERVFRNITLVNGPIIVLATVFLVYFYGAIGAAISNAIGVIILNVAGVIGVYMHLGISIFGYVDQSREIG